MRMSFVLPNHNNISFLAGTLDSLVKQSLSSVEIIVIDDCSNDGSVELIQWYKKKHRRIKLVGLEARKGAAYCRNLGNSLATSDLIMVCDSGDINHKNRASDAYGFFKKRKDVDIYSTACVEINALGEQVEAHFPRIFTDKEKPSLFHPTVVYRKRVTEAIRYREGNLATDQYEAFFFEAYRSGFKYWFSTEAMVMKLRLPESYGSSQLRIEQRMKNYKEFGISI